MSKQSRLEMLEQSTSSGSADPFAWYALALEYSSMNRVDDALSAFSTLRQNDANYVAMYLMCGTMLIKAGRDSEGREWLESGMSIARAKGEQHTLKELEEALNQVPPPPSITGY